MPDGFDLVQRLNATARSAGVVDAIAQFENVATHAQYRVPYAVTSRNIRAGDHVLDWGCGNGHFSLFLQSLGARITGYSFEPRPRALANASDFEFVAGSASDPRALPFPDATFDAAVGVGVLEHVWETGGNEAASLAELARVVRPGGVLLTFHLPNRGGWIERVVHGLRLNKHFHKRKFDEAEIRALWAAAGFHVMDLGFYSALPRAELRLLPGFLRHNPSFARLYDLVDDAVTSILPKVSTNFFIVAQKPDVTG
jgi:SAM-dependent methyltransferase